MGNLLGSPVTEKETHVGCTVDGTIQYGISSMQGWRVHMEDAHIAETNLYAIVVQNSSTDGNQQHQQKRIPLEGHALFAVFDGHGGSFAAEYAGANFCRVLSQQLGPYAAFCESRKSMTRTTNDNKSQVERVKYIRSGLELLETALRNAFIILDKEILLAVRDEPVPDANTPYHAATGSTTTTNNPTSKTLPIPNSDEDSGSTAVVVMITPDWIVCANAGDSRAVCCKQQQQQQQQQHKAVVPLSYDHKPDDEEEERRIRAAGGYVAAGRVEGDLAVSRGLGDFRFKQLNTVLNEPITTTNGTAIENDNDHHTTPYTSSTSLLPAGDQKVSPVPDIIVQNRSVEQDEFIIVACDGIWDVQTNYECVQMVADIFAEGEADLGLVCEEMLDMCLSMGSKDNMTSLIIKFPAQTIGDDGGSGGVLARRQKRNAVLGAPSRSRNDNPAVDDDDDEDMSHPQGGLYT